MTEKVGKVTLDMTYYPGEDFYSDGTIEDELLAIAKDHNPQEFPEIIEKKKNWPVFYHLSPFRTNVIDWIPIKKTDKVLDTKEKMYQRNYLILCPCGDCMCLHIRGQRN